MCYIFAIFSVFDINIRTSHHRQPSCPNDVPRRFWKATNVLVQNVKNRYHGVQKLIMQFQSWTFSPFPTKKSNSEWHTFQKRCVWRDDVSLSRIIFFIFSETCFGTNQGDCKACYSRWVAALFHFLPISKISLPILVSSLQIFNQDLFRSLDSIRLRWLARRLVRRLATETGTVVVVESYPLRSPLYWSRYRVEEYSKILEHKRALRCSFATELWNFPDKQYGFHH